MDTFLLIAAVITVVAFILAIPIAILSNALTPRVLEWWATTNTTRKERRIAVLNRKLGQLRIAIHPHSREHQLAKGLRFATYGLIVVTYLLVLLFAELLRVHAQFDATTILPNFPRFQVSGESGYQFRLILCGLLASISIGFFVMANNSFNYSSRTYLELQLEGVKKELSKLGI